MSEDSGTNGKSQCSEKGEAIFERFGERNEEKEGRESERERKGGKWLWNEE